MEERARGMGDRERARPRAPAAGRRPVPRPTPAPAAARLLASTRSGRRRRRRASVPSRAGRWRPSPTVTCATRCSPVTSSAHSTSASIAGAAARSAAARRSMASAVAGVSCRDGASAHSRCEPSSKKPARPLRRWTRAAAAANAGVQSTEDGPTAVFTADEVPRRAPPARPRPLYPPTTLVEVEDTQNRKGGLVWDREELERVGAAAREHGVASSLDGARLLDAAAARGDAPAALAAPFDLVRRAVQGPGCRWARSLPQRKRHRRRRPLPSDARWRDAPGRRARRRCIPRARAPCRPARARSTRTPG